jgi:hypothetical protein
LGNPCWISRRGRGRRTRARRTSTAPSRPTPRLRVREHRGIRELRSVVVESVHWEHHRDVVARGGVEFVAHGGRERALAGARGARDADEHARVAVAVAVERRRGEPRGELVDHRVHVLARGRPRRLHAGQGARFVASVTHRAPGEASPSGPVMVGAEGGADTAGNAAGRHRHHGRRHRIPTTEDAHPALRPGGSLRHYLL